MIQYKINNFQIFEFSHDNPKALLFFAHANGVPSLTYKHLFEKIVERNPVKIVSYDTRGIGYSTNQPIFSDTTWGWKQLVDDHVLLFKEIQKKYPHLENIIFSGHSLGAWLSLFATIDVPIKKLILFDPPILPFMQSFAWFFLNLFGQKHLNPQSKKVKKRKVSFVSSYVAQETFKKSSFMKKWSDTAIQNYIESSFAKENSSERITLRHLPMWEAHMFEQYPPTPFHGFFRIPNEIRKSIEPIFFIGEKSDVCNPNSDKWIRFLLPKFSWNTLPECGHMFPIENSLLLIEKIEPFLRKLL